MLRRRAPPDSAADRMLRQAEIEGSRLALLARCIGLGGVALLLLLFTTLEAWLIYLALLVAFVGLAAGQYRAMLRPGARSWLPWLIIVLDFALLTFTLLWPNPGFPDPWPRQYALRNGVQVYHYLLLASVAFTYSPRLMLFAGVAASTTWSAGVLWIMALPGTLTERDIPAGLSTAGEIAVELDPLFVATDVWVQDCVVMLLVSIMLAMLVARSRRRAVEAARTATERANLSRYFPPGVVDRLAARDRPFADTRAQDVAVLFCDLVGFTARAERLAPDDLLALLRRFHAGLEDCVFRHGGTLDKYLGDGVMATFGTPDPGRRDAADAIACGRAMLDFVAALNAGADAPVGRPLVLSVGIHYGRAVLGDIGGERRLEFAVLGDVVNVANRLEELTREVDAALLASDAAVAAARRQVPDEAERLLDGLDRLAPRSLRGRHEPTVAWRLARLAIDPAGATDESGATGG